MPMNEGRLPSSARLGLRAKVAMSALLMLSLALLLSGPARAAAPKFSLAVKNAEGGSVPLSHPVGVGTDSAGNAYIINGNHIEKFNSSGKYLAKFGSSGSGAGQLFAPDDVDVDASGNVWVADTGNERVAEFSSTGTFLRNVSMFEKPISIAADNAGDVWALSEELAFEISSSGKVINIIEPGAAFHQAVGIDVDSAGQIWVASDEAANPGVYRFSSTGTLLSHWSTAAGYPAGIAGDGSGNVWVAFPASCRVQKFSSTGASLEKFGECGTGSGKLGAMPTSGGGLALAPEGALWVSNSGVNEVQKWTP
jgi:tripartite motif-containing protein 71